MNQWLRSLFNKSTNCERCLETMEALLDGESNREEELFLFNHLDDCKLCFEHYGFASFIREQIHKKLTNRPVPEDLISTIKAQVRDIA